MIGNEINLKPRAIENRVKELRDERYVFIAKRERQEKGDVSIFKVSPRQFSPNQIQKEKIKEIGNIVTSFLEELDGLNYAKAVELFLIHLNKVKLVSWSAMAKPSSRTPPQTVLIDKYVKQLLGGEMKIRDLKPEHFIDKRFSMPEGTHIRYAKGKPVFVTIGEPYPRLDEDFLLPFYYRPVREMSSELIRYLRQDIAKMTSLYDTRKRRQQQGK